VICRDKLYDTVMHAHADNPDHTIEFFHGYTYSGHPVACAAAIATLDVFSNDNLFERAGKMGKLLGDIMHSTLKGLPHVIGVRSLGLASAVELASLPNLAGKRGYDIFLDCFHQGVLIRAAGDSLVLAPAYVVEPMQIDQMVNVLATSIKKHA